MLRVTFDSNVWLSMVLPERHTKDPSAVKINQAIVDRRVEARLSETVFTYENIKGDRRREFFALYTSQRPLQLNIESFLTPYLTRAFEIGVRLMQIPRVGGLQNQELRDEWFERPVDYLSWANRFGGISRRIEQERMAGRFHVVEICSRYSKAGVPWYKGFANAPTAEIKKISSAVAEWADGDSVAAHYAFNNDLFCTRDIASKAGIRSILSAENREWLRDEFGVVFVTPEELANRF